MGVNRVLWDRTNTADRYSGTIWANCPVAGLRDGSIPGYFFEENFSRFNITPATTEGNWTAEGGFAQFSGTGGVITAPAATAATKAGLPVRGITIGSDDDNEGVGIRTTEVGTMINRANAALWYECQFKKSSIANTILEFFVGLLENVALTAVIPITATAATLSDHNMVGIYSTESAGSTGNSTYKANGVTAVTVGSAEFTFVADTFTNVGFKYTPTGDKAGAYCLSFYQDGVRLASTKIIPDSNGTDFPTDVAMGPVLAVRNAAGSSPGTVTIRRWRCAQLYYPLD